MDARFTTDSEASLFSLPKQGRATGSIAVVKGVSTGSSVKMGGRFAKAGLGHTG